MVPREGCKALRQRLQTLGPVNHYTVTIRQKCRGSLGTPDRAYNNHYYWLLAGSRNLPYVELGWEYWVMLPNSSLKPCPIV